MVGISMVLVSMFAVVFSIAATAFWIWMLVDCLTQMDSQGNDKIIWALVILFANFLGASIYYFVQRPQNRLSGWRQPDSKHRV